MGRKYIWVEFCVKIFTYLILCEKLFRKKSCSENWPKKPKKAQKMPKIKKKNEKAPKKPKKARNCKIAKKARFFLGHSVQDCSKRTLVYMGIFFY